MVRIRDGKKIAHEGIKVEFVGSIGALVRHQFSTSYLLPQSSSMTEVTITNSCPSHRSLPHQERCGRHRRLISYSRTWRNNTKATKALMSSSGGHDLAP